jgi:hypothetical protein
MVTPTADTDTPPAADEPRGRPTGLTAAGAARLGVAGVVAVLVALGTLHALVVPPFLPPDETSHTAYALALSEGRYPMIDDFPGELPIPGMREGLSVWTSNHPPLVYLILAVPLRLGIALGEPLAGFHAARLSGVAAAAAGVALSAVLAALVVPRRPDVVVGAAALGGLIPHFVSTAGILYNDAWATLTATAALVAAALVLVRGPTRRSLGWLVAAATIALATRSSGAAAVAAAAGAAGLGTVLHRRDAWPWRLAVGIGAALGVAAVAVTVSAPMYLLNLQRYGDLTGRAALLGMFQREPRAPAFQRLAGASFWRDQQGQLFGQVVEGRYVPAELVLAVRGVVLLAIAALLAAGVRRAWRWRRHGETPDLARAATGLMLACYSAVIVYSVAEFAAVGGSQHARYLFPAAAVIGLAIAAGLGRLPYGWTLAWTAGAVGLWLAVNLVALRGFLVETYDLPASTALAPAAVDALAERGVPGAGVVVALLVTAGLAGLGCWLTAAWILARRGRAALDDEHPRT